MEALNPEFSHVPGSRRVKRVRLRRETGIRETLDNIPINLRESKTQVGIVSLSSRRRELFFPFNIQLCIPSHILCNSFVNFPPFHLFFFHFPLFVWSLLQYIPIDLGISLLYPLAYEIPVPVRRNGHASLPLPLSAMQNYERNECVFGRKEALSGE